MLLRLLAIMLFFPLVAGAQYSDTLHRERLVLVSASAGFVTASTYTILAQSWYSNYAGGDFHLFDDSREWLGMDKAGHAFSSYYIGAMGYHSLRWTGIGEKRAVWLGATWGSIYLLGIETMDGFSRGWGFSWADIAANTFGSALFMGQQALWKQQRIVPKFSFHTTDYPRLRPQLLGNSIPEQVLKDYNGQTYWLSINPASFAKESTWLPKWLSIAVGYGGRSMISAHPQPRGASTAEELALQVRYPVFYLAPEIDLHRVKTRYKWVNGLCKTLGWMKFPLPTLSVGQNGLEFIPIYF